MSVDWSRPIQTRDGRPARLLGELNVKQGNPYKKVVAVISEYGTHERAIICRSDGVAQRKGPRITNVPRKHVRWVNMYDYRDGISGLYSSREAADRGAIESRIACIRIEFEEGEGL